MNIFGSIFPLNTSKATVDRIIDAAVKGHSTQHAATNYKDIGTELVAAICQFLGWDHYAQDSNKLALEVALSKAYQSIGQKSNDRATPTDRMSDEFMLVDKDGIPRYYRLELDALDPQWACHFICGSILNPVAVCIYQYDQSTSNDSDITRAYYQTKDGTVKRIYEKVINQDNLPLTWSEANGMRYGTMD